MTPLLLLMSCTAPLPEEVEVEWIPGVGDLSADLYDRTRVHRVDILLPQEGLLDLRDHPWDYTQGSVVIDGVLLDEVGVHLKGAWGSFRDLDGKANFKLDLNQYVDGQNYLGLKQLTLNNMVVDCSYLRETLAYEAFARVGIPETRTSYVWVTVNEVDYGLYLFVETPDDVWLARHYDDPSGNLYDGKYIFTEDWEFVSMVDFLRYIDAHFELEEGEGCRPPLDDVHRVTDALYAAHGSDDGFQQLDALVDWDQLLRVWATEQWVGQLDGYFLNQNNYRVYFDPEDGRVDMLPWDMDYAFYEASRWGMDWDHPYGALAGFCSGDPTCRHELRNHVRAVAEILETSDLRGLLEEVVALTMPYAAVDPRACGASLPIVDRQDYMRAWVRTRSEAVREMWGL